MPVTVVPTSRATVAIDTFITELSSVIKNWAAASVSRTVPVRLPWRPTALATRPPYAGLSPPSPRLRGPSADANVEGMAKTWVLDTETKGTGAHVVPLKRAGRAPAPKLDTVTLRRPEQPARQPESDSTPTFKVVDVMSATVIAEGVDARGAVDALAGMRS